MIKQDKREELRRYTGKLKKSPLFIKIYFCGSLVTLITSFMLLILRFIFSFYTIDPYYLICAVIISSTLLKMSVISITENHKENKNGTN